eukprot:scaffold12435_cov185-Isochrysis_galbana.AAC.1
MSGAYSGLPVMNRPAAPPVGFSGCGSWGGGGFPSAECRGGQWISSEDGLGGGAGSSAEGVGLAVAWGAHAASAKVERVAKMAPVSSAKPASGVAAAESAACAPVRRNDEPAVLSARERYLQRKRVREGGGIGEG